MKTITWYEQDHAHAWSMICVVGFAMSANCQISVLLILSPSANIRSVHMCMYMNKIIILPNLNRFQLLFAWRWMPIEKSKEFAKNSKSASVLIEPAATEIPIPFLLLLLLLLFPEFSPTTILTEQRRLQLLRSHWSKPSQAPSLGQWQASVYKLFRTCCLKFSK